MNNIVTALPIGTRYAKIRPLRQYIADNHSGVIVACYTPKTNKNRSEQGVLLLRAPEGVEVKMNVLRPIGFKTLGDFVFIDIDCAHCDNLEKWLTMNSPVPVEKDGFLYMPKDYMCAYQELWKTFRKDPWEVDFWAYVRREICIPQF